MSLFVLGTDTEVGKTVVAALICQRYRHLPGLAYWKPVASGSAVPEQAEAGDTTGEGLAVGGLDAVDRLAVRALVGGIDLEDGAPPESDGVSMLAEGYSFPDPVSPHLAARRVGERVEVERLSAMLATHLANGRRLVIEGIGGVLVPFDDDGSLFADWAAESGLPAVVVTRTALGTINHTLLTLEALRSRGVPLAGVVMNGCPDDENRRAIARFGNVPIVAEVPPVESLDAASLARLADRFDPDASLEPLLMAEDRSSPAGRQPTVPRKSL